MIWVFTLVAFIVLVAVFVGLNAFFTKGGGEPLEDLEIIKVSMGLTVVFDVAFLLAMSIWKHLTY